MSDDTRRLTDLIGRDCPLVHESNWQGLCNLGWRWAENLPVRQTLHCIKTIQDAQDVHGVEFVTLGDVFFPTLRHPKIDPSGFGIGFYIRDVEDQVTSLQKVIDAWNESYGL